MRVVGFGQWWIAGWALVGALGLGADAAASEAGTNAPPVQRPRAMLVAPTQGPVEPTVTPVEAPAIGEAPAVVTPGPATPSTATPSTAKPSTATPSTATPSAAATPSDDPTAPAPKAPPAPRGDATSNEPTVHRAAQPRMRTFSHRGFTTDLRIGTIGCLRGACGDRHGAKPGFRIDGFIGGNIRGWVDLGFSGGWGTMNADVPTGTNMLTLYGLDPYQLQTALGVLGGQALGIDLGSLAVNDTKLRTAQFGPLLRVHFIPRGRFAAYVGSGVQYNLFRARYGTTGGPSKLDFHGLAVPIEAGFGVHVLENLALGVQFDYLWTWYGLANLEHGETALTLPVRFLDEAKRMQNGGSFRDQLPQFWTFAFALRARI